jgi:hypothetical protein
MSVFRRPLRGKDDREGGFAAAVWSVPRRLRGRPSGLKGAAHRCATAALDPKSLCGPWAGDSAGRPRPAPTDARHTTKIRKNSKITLFEASTVRGDCHSAARPSKPPSPTTATNRRFVQHPSADVAVNYCRQTPQQPHRNGSGGAARIP